MSKFMKVIAALAIAVMPVSAGLADEGDKYGYVLGSYLDPDVVFDQDTGYGLQIGLGKEISKMWNIEAYLRSTRADGSVYFKNTALGGDLQLVFNRDGKFEPYLLGGIGIQRTDLTGFDTENDAVVNFGVGFNANIFGNSRATLRGEYRYLDYNSQSLRLDDQLYSLGVQFPFGKKAAPIATPAPAPAPAPAPKPAPKPAPILDGDKDGVVDRLDKCPNSKAGVEVDVNGCEIKEEIRLPGVNFESNSDRLLPGAESVLGDAAATLRKNPAIKVEVAGHTDSDGAADYNESLSARRAATVRDYLASNGVAVERMTVRGYGEAEPIDSNATPAGKAANRRVVLRITAR
jgi:OOP family OmpA-OmpF porin